MSVLINMEMPKSCGYCPFKYLTMEGDECMFGVAYTTYQGRPKDCPLSPVPPHGDLVERDALMELYADEDDLRLENMKVPIAVIRQNIMDMPTIIPADEPFGKSEQLNL